MKRPSFPYNIAAVFLLSLIYWFYLALTTRMIIAFDSIGYESLGRMIMTQPWIDYFKTGPNREPLYPILIASSMQIGHLTGIAYTRIMAFFGILLLCATQVLMYAILKKMRVSKGLSTLILAYFAISPAINNAAFSLYSEILAMPLILLLLLVNINAFQSIRTGTVKDALSVGFYLGLIFCAVSFVKGIFELIFWIFVLLYLLASLAYFFQGKKNMAVNCLVALLTFSCCYQIPLTTYKLLNKTYNGHYALTNRGSWAFYSSCARRAEKLDSERLLSALAYIPGKGFCEAILGKEKCYFWGIETLDSFGSAKLNEVAATTPPSMIDQKMMALSKEKIMENPVQFLFLTGLDGLKMFFWESTRIGFVIYPPWLRQLYDDHLLKDTWRAVISLLCLAGFIFLVFNITTAAEPVYAVLIFVLLSGFIGFYALFDTIPRFALPIAPLELIAIALLGDAMYNATHAKNHKHLRP